MASKRPNARASKLPTIIEPGPSRAEPGRPLGLAPSQNPASQKAAVGKPGTTSKAKSGKENVTDKAKAVISQIAQRSRSILGSSTYQQQKQPAPVKAKAAASPPQQIEDPVPIKPSRRASQSRRGSITRPDEMEKLRSEYDILQEKLSQLRSNPGAASAPASKHEPLRPVLNTQQQQQAAQQSLQPVKSFTAAATDPLDAMDLDAPSALQGDGTAVFSFQKLHNFELGKMATEVFEEPAFHGLCQEVLFVQLQRTKDGATKDSRITELAGLVRKLRRALNEASARAHMFVDQCVKFEKDNIDQIKLGADSSIKGMEAELAKARKQIASVESMYKKEKASWVSELESKELEVNNLKRDQERLEEVVEQTRQAAQRSEELRMQATSELKELKKQMEQQLRDVNMHRNVEVHGLAVGKRDLEKANLALQEECAKLEKERNEAEAKLANVSDELSNLWRDKREIEAQLREVTDSEAGLQDELQEKEQQLETQIGELQTELASWQSKHNTAMSACAAAQEALSDMQKQNKALQTELDLKALLLGNANSGKQELQVAQAQAEQQMSELQLSLRSAQAALEMETQQLASTKAELEQVSTAQQHNQQELERLTQQMAEVVAARDALASEVKQAREQLEKLQAELAASKSEVVDLSAELQEKSARLAHLEGEFGALQEVLGDTEQRDVVNQLLAKVASLQNAAAAAEAKRRQLHNELVELRGNIRVFCRVKPHKDPTARCLPGNTSLSLLCDGKENPFTFDRVFDPNVTQQQVFSEVSELVQSALDGYHVCLFSYGQTGAGKTFTMQGSDTPAGRGVIPRAVEKILECASKLEDQEWQYTMEASFIEIYNNTLRDLLADGAGRVLDQNAIKHDPHGGHTTVAGACRVPVTSAGVAAQLIQKATAARACEATAMNATSSRSHVVFMLYISGNHPPSETRLHGCLSLVDLAGSERLDRSLAEDQRKKEACSINQSLSSLGDVFTSLAAKSNHIPYRNSKLTYLLQPCLGGAGKTLMFVNINPEPASAFETLCSLKFAAKVNNCQTAARGGAKRNITQGGAELPAGEGRRMSMVPVGRPSAMGTQPSAAEMKRMSLAGATPSHVGAKRVAPAADGRAGGSKRGRY